LAIAYLANGRQYRLVFALLLPPPPISTVLRVMNDCQDKKHRRWWLGALQTGISRCKETPQNCAAAIAQEDGIGSHVNCNSYPQYAKCISSCLHDVHSLYHYF